MTRMGAGIGGKDEMGARKTTLNMALRRDRWQGQATALGPARPFSVSQKRANASSESLVKGCLKRIRGVHSFSRGRHLIRCADEGEIRLTILVFASPAARSSISSILRAKIRPTGPVNTARGAFREGKHVYVNFGFRPETSPRRHPVSQGPVSQGPVERSDQEVRSRGPIKVRPVQFPCPVVHAAAR